MKSKRIKTNYKNIRYIALIPKFYIDAVVSIGVRQTNDSIAWINRHVFEGKASVVIRMRETQNNALVLLDVTLSDCRVHPFADIAAVMLSGTTITNRHLNFFSFDIDENAFNSFELRDNGVDKGSLVYMLGFPMGLVNVNSELPICRMGCIARISEEQISESHDALLDIQNFPGNS